MRKRKLETNYHGYKFNSRDIKELINIPINFYNGLILDLDFYKGLSSNMKKYEGTIKKLNKTSKKPRLKEQSIIWLRDYMLENYTIKYGYRIVPNEIRLDLLQARLPKTYTLYRGLYFFFDVSYLKKVLSGKDIQLDLLSTTTDIEVAKSFSKFGYIGMVLKYEISYTNILVDTNLLEESKEKEVILNPGEYNVEILEHDEKKLEFIEYFNTLFKVKGNELTVHNSFIDFAEDGIMFTVNNRRRNNIILQLIIKDNILKITSSKKVIIPLNFKYTVIDENGVEYEFKDYKELLLFIKNEKLLYGV